MGKTEVLVDAGFLQKLSAEGKNVQAFKRVLEELEFVPVVHPYIATGELDMFPYFKQLTNEGYIRKAQYNEFLSDDSDKELYSQYFMSIHEDLRKYLQASGRKKKIDKLILPKGISIFDYRKAGLSLGDVHMVLMASFTGIPVILSDDSDMDILKVIAKKKISYSRFELSILDCVDVLEKIALMENSAFSKNELIDILKNAGEAKNKSVIKQAWNKSHVS